MLAHSYLVIGPHRPEDVGSAAITQRHTIPLVWAFLTGAEKARFVEEDDLYYFALNVNDGLGILDRGIKAWSYNAYFHDTLAPVKVFREWLQKFSPEISLYINVSELINLSPTPDKDIESLRRLGERVREALLNIEKQQFTHFLNDIRMMAHPFITVPITGDRLDDVFILAYEVRDTESVEEEMALQLVGVDRDKSLLYEAIKSIPKLVPDENLSAELIVTAQESDEEKKEPTQQLTTVFVPEGTDVKEYFIDHLGMKLERETLRFIYFESEGRHLKVVKLAKPIVQEVEEKVKVEEN